MKFTLYTLLIASLSLSPVYAQKEAAVWLFHEGITVDFNSDPPLVSDKGQLFAPVTGIASICNKKGELLFYTNGETIYDGRHEAVPNGTGFTWTVSSDANMVIIPGGVRERKYYLVTADAQNLIIDEGGGKRKVDCCYKNDTTTSYTIVYVDADKKVSIGQKNIPLLKPGYDVVAATKHANGIDTWLLTMKYNTKKFYAFLFSECGVSQPVISEVEVDVWEPYSGPLLFSPDGKKLLASLAGNFLMDFDSNTGIVSNPINITNYLRTDILAFSPGSKYIYSNYNDGISYSEILLQYDIQNNAVDSIVIPHANASDSAFGLDMSPAISRKMYFNGESLRNILCAIENPDEPLTKNHLIYDLGLLKESTYISDFPIFPNFISSYFDPDYASRQADIGVPEIEPPPRMCMEDTAHFKVTKTKAVNEYFWDFGDGETAYNVKEPKHCYKEPGVFTARLIVRYNCMYDTIYTNVLVDAQRNPSMTDTVIHCGTTFLKAGSGYETYLWNTGESCSEIEVPSGGIYTVKLSNACGNYADTYHVLKPEIKAYNLITPNNDGKNEYLYFDQISLPGNLIIYNRWGDIIYENKDYKNNWPAEKLNDGIYYYQFNYEGCPVYKNWLHILR